MPKSISLKDPAYCASVRVRIKNKIDTSTGCWAWLGRIHHSGYGTVKIGRTDKLAHRISYEVFVGPIPEGLELDHLCRIRHCVNPAHLEPVTTAENVRRGRQALGTWGRGLSVPQTTCKRGHPLDEENTYIIPKTGSRSCKECTRQRGQEYRRRLRAKTR